MRLLTTTILLLSTSLCLPAAALAQDAAAAPAFDIPAQPLADAIFEFGQQSGMRVMLQGAPATDIRSHAVAGHIPSAAALKQLLAGTGITIQQQSGGLFVLRVSPRARNHASRGARTEPRSEEVTVSGRQNVSGGGMMVRQVEPKTRSEITQDYISKQAPTLTPAALIAVLPGVQSDDQGPVSIGNDTMHVRGLSQAEIGYVFEGIPYANPFTYDPNTASAVDDENIRSVSMIQGSVDLTAPLYNADGAEMSISEIGPHDKPGVLFDGAGGSHSLQKEFIRLDSGYIGHSGVKAFASYSYEAADMWRGPGDTKRWHLDSALHKDWSDRSYSDFIFSWNQQSQTNFENPTLAEWREYGDSYNYSGTYKSGSTNYYADNLKPTTSYIMTLRNHIDLGRGFTLDAQPYYYSAPGTPTSMSTIPYKDGYIGAEEYSHLDGYSAKSGSLTTVSFHPNTQSTAGLTVTGNWTRGDNTLSVFDWYSYTVHTEFDEYYAVDGNGDWSQREKPLTVDGRTLSSYNINGLQQINALGLDDRLKLLGGKLTIDAGAKFNMVSRQFTDDVPNADPYKGIGNIFVPTPQVLISYDVDRHNQIYIDGTTGYHAPTAYTTQVAAYTISTGRPSSTAMNPWEPEFMIGEEIGWRYTGGVMVNLALFNYNMTNHQVSSETLEPGGSYYVSSTINAGGETARGAQAEIGTRPWHHLSFYGSAQYLHATIDNNVETTGDALPTAGKTEVGAPKLVAATGFTYDDGKWFGNFNFRYTDSQYSTLMNDESMPAYFTADASIGRNLPTLMHRFHPKIMLNLINLGDVHYLSSVTGYTAASKTTKGVYGTSISGSSPTYIVGTGFTAIADVTIGFE